MTELEKTVYNTYLRISRTRSGKHFKYRKKFDNFEDNKAYVPVKKIAKLLLNHPHIDINDFFNAPYEVYPEKNYEYGLDINFYTTLKATGCYSIFKKMCDDRNPDEQIESIKKSLYFIYIFCKDNEVDIEKYLDHKTNAERTFMLHLRERKVNIYTLFGLSNFDNIMSRMEPNAAKFTLGHLYLSLDLYRSRYYNSKVTINVVSKAIKKLTKILKNI